MKRLLVVVDMQKDFIDGSLGTKEAQTIVPKVAEKIREYQSAEMRLFLPLIPTMKIIWKHRRENAFL